VVRYTVYFIYEGKELIYTDKMNVTIRQNVSNHTYSGVSIHEEEEC